jgi:uncharacterized damage-inducible protein DinB
MALKDGLIAELKHESSMTKKILGKVPMDKKDWRPHEKSMTLGRLATHIAENLKWISNIRTIGEYDFLTQGFKSHTAGSNEELLELFQTNLDNAIKDLSEMSQEDFDEPWVVKRGEHVMFNAPKKVAIRGWALSHSIHHRGQLSVYLRLLDIPVPGMYGPSADEK